MNMNFIPLCIVTEAQLSFSFQGDIYILSRLEVLVLSVYLTYKNNVWGCSNQWTTLNLSVQNTIAT